MTEEAIDLEFGKVSFKDNILIAELNEGVLFDVDSNRILLNLGKKTFKDQPYGYISNRVNSYAVNPMVYLESAASPTLKAIAVVTTDAVCKQNAFLEKQFYKENNSFGIFATLEEAIEWIKEKI